MQIQLKNPRITTVWPINSRADIKTTIAKINAKLQTYGVISDLEQQYLQEHQEKIHLF